MTIWNINCKLSVMMKYFLSNNMVLESRVQTPFKLESNNFIIIYFSFQIQKTDTYTVLTNNEHGHWCAQCSINIDFIIILCGFVFWIFLFLNFVISAIFLSTFCTVNLYFWRRQERMQLFQKNIIPGLSQVSLLDYGINIYQNRRICFSKEVFEMLMRGGEIPDVTEILPKFDLPPIDVHSLQGGFNETCFVGRTLKYWG